MAVTYHDLYLDLRRAMEEAGIEGAPLEARELVCTAAGKTKESLLRDGRLDVPERVERAARDFLKRRLAGEPAAYLIGEWEFYGLPLTVRRGVLIPRIDTEVLAEQAIRCVNALGGAVRVLDLCAGSGCVGLAVAAHCPNCTVILADRSEAALETARENTERNHLSQRVQIVAADVFSVPQMGEFDCIVCNPPYIPAAEIAFLDTTVRDYEPHMALDGGADGLDFYRAILRNWSDSLRCGGYLLFEFGIGQADAVRRLMLLHGFEGMELYRDTCDILRVISGVRK